MALWHKEVLLSIFATFSLAFAFPEEKKLWQNAMIEREIPTMTVVSTKRPLFIRALVKILPQLPNILY